MTGLTHSEYCFDSLHDAYLANIDWHEDGAVSLRFVDVIGTSIVLAVDSINEPTVIASGVVMPLIVSNPVFFLTKQLSSADIPLIGDSSGVLFWEQLNILGPEYSWVLVIVVNVGDDLAIFGKGVPSISYTG